MNQKAISEMDQPKKGTYQWLEFTCDDQMLQEIIPLLAEQNDKFESDKLPSMVLLYPSQKGNRVIVMNPIQNARSSPD